jgi:protein phosphatase
MTLRAPPPAPDAFHGDTGPFDLIGDVHGCAGELETLLQQLGYRLDMDGPAGRREYEIEHPEGRKPVLLGDLVDRGPRTPDVMRLAMHLVGSGRGYCVVGNHDDKFRRWLAGRKVAISHGIQTTIEQFENEPDAFHGEVARFIDALPSHLVLDRGALVVAHAGVHADMHGEESSRVRAFAMYGEVTGERDRHGLPVRRDWARRYSGEATVVHGHVAEPEIRERNNVVCVDTGCVFGGHLTAMRWPEREIVQVPAEQTWFSSPRWG